MKIFAISDIHGETKYIDSAAELIEKADLVAVAGDISKSGKMDSAEKVISCIEKYNRNIIAIHGNWDRIEVHDLLVERGYGIHDSGKIIDDIGFFGVGGSSPTPMNTVSEYDEEEISDFIKNGFNMVRDCEKKILLSHTPPRYTKDKTFFGLRGGSRSVREFIEKNPVDLCLSGHIHEASGVDYLNSCTIANPGSFKKGKYLIAQIDDTISVELGKVRSKVRK